MFEFITILLAASAVVYVAMPFIKPKQTDERGGSSHHGKLDDLLHQQTVLHNTIEDLEFDFQTGKLSMIDYDALVAEHKKSLNALDARVKEIGGVTTEQLVANLEQEIAAVRQKIAPQNAAVCAECSTPIKQGDKFCSNCGAKLS